jgi:hypothetical protein
MKRNIKLSAIICLALTLVLSYYIYFTEFKYKRDKSSLAEAITEFTTPFNSSVDAYVLEIKEMKGVLVASFRDKTRLNLNGVAIFSKGFNQRYRIISSRIEPSDYSSVLDIHRIKIKDHPYYVISGYNFSDEIKTYGLDFYGYLHPGNYAKDRVKETIKFELVNQQFMDIYSYEEINNLLENSIDRTLYDASVWSTSMYDADGQDITENFRIKDSIGGPKGMVGKAELFLIYVFIAIVLGIGLLMTRYFLTE